MARPNLGLKLQYKQPKGYAKPLYFVVWYEQGRRRERATGTDDLRRAQGYQAQLSAEVSRGGPGTARLNPDAVTIGEVLDRYARNVFDRARSGSLKDPQRIAIAIENLLPFWGGLPVGAVNLETRDRFVVERKTPAYQASILRAGDDENRRPRPIRDDIANNTIRRELGVLRDAIYFAHEAGVIASAPRLKIPKATKPRDDNYYTRQEVAALLRAARKQVYTGWQLCLFILIAVYMGARETAILSLHWSRNDDGGWIDIERMMIVFGRQGGEESNKRTASSVIPTRLQRFIRYAYARRTSDYVFELRGKRIADNKRSFKTALVDAGFASRGRFRHTLRDTCITWLLDAGLTQWQVSKFVGVSTEMISRVYGKKIPLHLTEGRGTLARRLRLSDWCHLIQE